MERLRVQCMIRLHFTPVLMFCCSGKRHFVEGDFTEVDLGRSSNTTAQACRKMQVSRKGILDWFDHWHPNRREDIPVMMACWKPPSPRSQAYAQSGTVLAGAQRYAIGVAALLQEASNAEGLSANATLLSSRMIRVLLYCRNESKYQMHKRGKP